MRLLLSIYSLFSNVHETPKKTSVHRGIDDGGKSTVTSVYFEFKQGYISIQCYNYSLESNDQNHLRIGINTNEYVDFLTTRAYE